MKIDRLDLIAYGNLTNTSFDIAGTGRSMVVVYGDNEAGKTTALNAIRHWLFGFEHLADEVNFRHKASSLRVGGILSNSAESLASIRRKGRKDTLLASDGKTPLADHALADFLKAISQQQFVDSFGLTHESLRTGGKQIAEGEGDLGAALFAAASGVANLQKMRADIAKRKEELFTPRGSNPKINAALKAYSDAKKDWEASMVKAAEAERLHADVDLRRRKLEELKSGENRLRAEAASLERLRDSRELVLRSVALDRERAKLRGVVPLRSSFAADYAAVMPEIRQAENNLVNLDNRIRQIEAEIDAIVVDEAVLAVADQVESAHAKREDVELLRTSVGGTEQLIRDKLGEASQALRRLGLQLPDDLEAFKDKLRLSERETKRIKKLAADHGKLTVSIAASERAVLAQRTKLAKASAKRENLPQVSRSEPLQAAIEEASRVGDIEERAAKLRAEIAAYSSEIDAGRSRLGCRHSWEEILAAAVPSAEGIELHRLKLDETERGLADLRRTRAELAAELLEREADFAKQQASDALPGAADLAGARKRRDRGWALVQRVWLRKEWDADEVADFTGAEATERSLAEHYAEAAASSDHVADRLMAEADRVRTRLELEFSILKTKRQIAQQEADEAAAAAEREARWTAWRSLWAAASIAPLTPQEMAGWLRDWLRLRELIGQLAERSRELDRLERTVADLSDLLRRTMSAVAGKPGSGARQDGLRSLLIDARSLQKQHNKEEADRLKLEESGAEASDALQTAEADQAILQHERAKWSDDWTAATARLADAGFGMLLPDQLDDVLDGIADFFKHMNFRREQAIELKRRLEIIDLWRATALGAAVHLGESEAFNASVNPPVLVAGWHARVEAAKGSRTRLHDRSEQLEKLWLERPTLEAELATAMEGLQRLLGEAGAGAAEQLPTRIAHANDLRDLDRRSEDGYLAPLRRIAASAGCTPDEIVARAVAADGRDLAAEIAAAERELDDFDRRREAAAIELGDSERQLTELLNRRGGIDQREQMESALARIRDLVPDYALLVLAEAVLARALERYRERNKSDLFESASRFFQRLTCSRFEGLELDQDDKDRQFLVGVRCLGETTEKVAVAGMSDGTCDQLFLALRLAHIEKHVREHGPFPIVVDDILLTFDDERAAAALNCLADLSARTQVLFFTHHRHLRDMVAQAPFRDRIGILDMPRA